MLSGCGGGSDSTPAITDMAFTASKVSGKTFAYTSSTGSGTLAFNADNTWITTVGAFSFSGTWSIDSSGKLVCVTTSGGNHTITYKLTNVTTNSLNASAVEVNPSDANNPSNYTATFTAIFTTNQVSEKSFTYSSGGSTGTLAFKADGTWSTTIGTSTFSGTWSIDSNGKLACVTTAGGDHTNTYTQLINNSTSVINTSVIEVNPAEPANPKSYNATLVKI
jgi:phage-related protein